MSSSASAKPSSSSQGSLTNAVTGQLSEAFIQESFHHHLKSSFAQAKLEGLLKGEVLSSAEKEFVITGPALCLYFAALRSNTDPPSVALPLGNTSRKRKLNLSYHNCPPAFITFMKAWAKTVPPIQRLRPEYQHDLARAICGLEPLAQPTNAEINGYAASLRAVAIEIGQRRSFQDRVAASLEAELDVHTPYTPPTFHLIPSSSRPPSIASCLSSRSSASSIPSWASSMFEGARRSGSSSAVTSTSSLPIQAPPSPTTTVISELSPTEMIRETLYTSLEKRSEQLPSLRKLLVIDRTRAYYASMAFSICDVATTETTSDGELRCVGGKRLKLTECTSEARPMLLELTKIGIQAKELDEEDRKEASGVSKEEGRAAVSRKTRVSWMLELGVGGGLNAEIGGDGAVSVDSKCLEFANRVNSLALSLTTLKAFSDTQDRVFNIVTGNNG
ncbi:hypothetical protein FA15DRAFT_676443 [Coprinopsis marcescibilis]|uniref:Uncharacterized protein n=1 Tax=Coprinopsis marcescibilis TaxID=230819 RepID=A0A5C3KBC8_COPMA|nr:hypothetical protein FA15DRAFT_676443 [Coprinopsis marcescibilis]